MPGVAFPLVELAARYGYLGVHLFFVISGFVILMSAQAATERNFAARVRPGSFRRYDALR
jgi:peptidoglycan/LPS O-acetylase OafA/YrhL